MCLAAAALVKCTGWLVRAMKRGAIEGEEREEKEEERVPARKGREREIQERDGWAKQDSH